MNKTYSMLLKLSAFSIVAGAAIGAVGIYQGGFEALVIPDTFLTVMSYFGMTL